MVGLCGMSMCTMIPPRYSTFHAQEHQGCQTLIFQAKVGSKRAQFLLDTRTIDCSFINTTMCKRLKIAIKIPKSAYKMDRTDRSALPPAVDPMEFSHALIGDPQEIKDVTNVPLEMFTPVVYNNCEHATLLGRSTISIKCQDFRTNLVNQSFLDRRV